MEKNSSHKKVAIVHDFLLYPGGAEVVLRTLCALYPEAPIYTLLYDKEQMGTTWSGKRVHTSFLQKWPTFLRKRHRLLLPFFASAVESFDLREYDLVISSSGAWSKGLVTRLKTEHVAYIHSPMRYVWDENERYLRRAVKRKRFLVRQLLSYLRVWDFQAAQRPDMLVANSHYTADRIAKYYRLRARVVYPAVEAPAPELLERSVESNDAKPFVIISRLVQYKNIAIAVDVCNKLQLPLVVVGTGPDEDALHERAGSTVEFTGYVDESKKWEILSGARAFLFPAQEDFGIVCVEALHAGIPVIGLNRGALPEVVTDGEHGILFDRPTVEVMADGLRRFLAMEDSFDSDVLRSRGSFFTQERFLKDFEACVPFSKPLNK